MSSGANRSARMASKMSARARRWMLIPQRCGGNIYIQELGCRQLQRTHVPLTPIAHNLAPHEHFDDPTDRNVHPAMIYCANIIRHYLLAHGYCFHANSVGHAPPLRRLTAVTPRSAHARMLGAPSSARKGR